MCCDTQFTVLMILIVKFWVAVSKPQNPSCTLIYVHIHRHTHTEGHTSTSTSEHIYRHKTVDIQDQSFSATKTDSEMGACFTNILTGLHLGKATKFLPALAVLSSTIVDNPACTCMHGDVDKNHNKNVKTYYSASHNKFHKKLSTSVWLLDTKVMS